MQTWDRTKPVENDKVIFCNKCAFHTFRSWGEYDGVLLECPLCGDKVSTRNLYLCSICGTYCWGVDDYNWHTLHHWVGYQPLPQAVADAMQKLEPGLWNSHLRYTNKEHTNG